MSDRPSSFRASAFLRPSSFVIRHSPRAAFAWPIALIIVALIAALLIAFIFYRTETWPMRSAHQGVGEAERVAREVKSAFVDVAHLQPRVTINNRVYLEQTTATSELSILSRRIEVEHEFENSWAGSAKRLKLHGTFNARAGFDLRQNVAVDVRPEAIVVELPHAQILGIDQQQVDVLEFENGFWNRISGQDVQAQLAVLPQLARDKAQATDLPVQAEEALRQQLTARIHAERPLRIEFGGATAKD